MKKLYVIIGRFQPFHNGHKAMIDTVLDLAKENGDHVAVLVGSSNTAKSYDNPLSFGERRLILIDEYEKEYAEDMLSIHPLPDFPYDISTWCFRTTELIKRIGVDTFQCNVYEFDTFIVTSTKGDDHSLRGKWFGSGYNYLYLSPVKWKDNDLSATYIRNKICDGGWVDDINLYIPDSTYKYLSANKSAFDACKMDYDTILKYKALWKDAPFTPTFEASDAVVRDKTGRFLFVIRGGSIGNGAVALCGGFLEANLTHEENIAKELLEETGLDLSVVPHTFIANWFCDDVNRGKRGRMSTMVFLIQLQKSFDEIEGLKGGDDAQDILIVDESTAMGLSFFSDHFGLLNKVLMMECNNVPYIRNH